MKAIFEQIHNVKKPVFKSKEETVEHAKDTFSEVLNEVSEEIQSK